MKVFIIETDISESIIHKIDIENGDYLTPRRLTGNMVKRASDGLVEILKERPSKVIVEKIARGESFLDNLINTMQKHGISLSEDCRVTY